MSSPPAPPRRPARIEFLLARLWHALLFGGFAVAYVTGDEDTYAMHLFAGYLVLAAVGLRIAMHLAAPVNSPLRLRRPSLGALTGWLRRPVGRSPLLTIATAVLLAAVAVAAVSGVVADSLPWVEDFHEGASQWALMLAVVHAVLVVVLLQGRRLWARFFTNPAA